jgi:hypothetical protein
MRAPGRGGAILKQRRAALWLLAIGNAFAIWSAFNPSFFTLRKFVQREGTRQDIEDAKAGMLAAAAAIAGMVVAVAIIDREEP